jgi:hypothetical protein
MTGEELLAAFPEEVRVLALRTRNVVLEEFPDAVVTVRGGWTVITFGRSEKMAEQVDDDGFRTLLRAAIAAGPADKP